MRREQGRLHEMLAVCSNWLVHFSHEVSTAVLYQICSTEIGDVTALPAAMRWWFEAHPDMVDSSL